MPGTVLYDAADGVATLTLNRPRVRNAVDGGLARDLQHAVAEAEAAVDVAVMILAANGAAFCAGADLNCVAGARTEEMLVEPGGFAGFVRYPRTKPVIAAVQGPAVAGGFEMVLACDLVVMADSAHFSLPEVTLDLVATGGGTIRLPRRLPPPLALELMLTGDPIDAARALDAGLVNRVVPTAEVGSAARELALRIAANGPHVVRESLRLARFVLYRDEPDLWEQADAVTDALSADARAHAGARRFLDSDR